MCFNMEEIIKLDTVDLYNKLYGVETLHPLVSVVDASEIKQDLPANVTLNYGLYALYLKQTKCGDLRYGRQLYDYQEGTVTSFAPGQVVEVRRDTNVRPQWQGVGVSSRSNTRYFVRARHQAVFLLFVCFE